MKHEFVFAGEYHVARDGRKLKLCSECGKANIGTGHSVPVPSLATGMLFVKQPVVVPREVRMLALALDAVLDMPLDAVGWRVHLRANDLRTAITDIPRDPDPHPVEIPQPVDMPVAKTHQSPVRARARSSTKAIANEKMRAVATRAVEHGWRLAKTGSGHYRLEKEGKSLIFAATTGDARAWRNFRALAKRHGINVEDI